MKLKEVFEKSVQFFKNKKIETARLDVELLLSYVLDLERVQIYLKYEQPLSESEVQKCRDVIKRRAEGEPVAYITGEKGFYGEMFSVGKGVLIPRPETELIVEQALDFIKTQKITAPKVLDLGAGSGCIGFSILKNHDAATLVSIEKSEEAYKFLVLNQNKLMLTERSRLLLKDVLSADLLNEKFDIIVANPPYVDKNDAMIEANVKKYEPHAALFSEKEGCSAIFDWSAKYRESLNKPGLMIFEMGFQQGDRMVSYFENFKQFSEVKIIKDLSKLDRIIKSTQ